MTQHTIEEAKQQLAAFEQTLRDYDNSLVDALADAVAAADVDSLEGPASPGLTPDEWLDVLETTAGDVYAVAHQPPNVGLSDSEHTWYCRHDGEAFIYGTEHTGELYRGDRDANAARQIRSVVEQEDARPRSMDQYPLEGEELIGDE